ncbi:MAG: ORF6N domain-containing protein [Verrucomicrobia bacterium]|nr:ORF6N domain-containing protein [Verrucomicrobiota bacterium]
MPAKKKSPAAPKPATAGGLLVPEKIAPLVHYLRHEKVILDSDLAELYGVTTGRLNEAVKRNLDRFPADFMFQLTEDETENLRSQTVISRTAGSLGSQSATHDPAQTSLLSQIAIAKNAEPALLFQSGTSHGRGGRRLLPYAFTEQGVAMLSSVLRSPRAVQVNIAIMRTFVQIRRLMDSNALLAEKIEALEDKYAEHDQHIQIIFDAIKQLIAADSDAKAQPKREIGFHAE